MISGTDWMKCRVCFVVNVLRNVRGMLREDRKKPVKGISALRYVLSHFGMIKKNTDMMLTGIITGL